MEGRKKGMISGNNEKEEVLREGKNEVGEIGAIENEGRRMKRGKIMRK